MSTDTLHTRVDPEFKESVTQPYSQKDATVSAAVRQFHADELATHPSALDTFNAIMASADTKLEAADLPELTIEDINRYIAQVCRQHSS